jgi:hypothetical protein
LTKIKKYGILNLSNEREVVIMRSIEYVYTAPTGEVTIYKSYVAVVERLNRSGGHYKVRLEDVPEPPIEMSAKRRAMRAIARARA